MEGWQIAIVLKPFLLLAFFVGIVFPIKWLLDKAIPDCWIKRILFNTRWKV